MEVPKYHRLWILLLMQILSRYIHVYITLNRWPLLLPRTFLPDNNKTTEISKCYTLLSISSMKET